MIHYQNRKTMHGILAVLILLTGIGSEASAGTLSACASPITLCANPFRYSEYYSDAESGLYYCNARYYSPRYGIFITRDTYDLSNRRSYCEGNPVMYSDPEGHMREGMVADALGIVEDLVSIGKKDLVSYPVKIVESEGDKARALAILDADHENNNIYAVEIMPGALRGNGKAYELHYRDTMTNNALFSGNIVPFDDSEWRDVPIPFGTGLHSSGGAGLEELDRGLDDDFFDPLEGGAPGPVERAPVSHDTVFVPGEAVIERFNEMRSRFTEILSTNRGKWSETTDAMKVWFSRKRIEVRNEEFPYEIPSIASRYIFSWFDPLLGENHELHRLYTPVYSYAGKNVEKIVQKLLVDHGGIEFPGFNPDYL